MPYLLVYRKTGARSNKPTVSKLTLNQVIAAGAIYEQLWIIADILQRERWPSVEENTFVPGGGKS